MSPNIETAKREVLRIVRELSLKAKDIGDRELAAFDYLDGGLIDSLQIVEMMAKLEEAFAIRFSPEQLGSERFRTLHGVSEIIVEIVSKSDGSKKL